LTRRDLFKAIVAIPLVPAAASAAASEREPTVGPMFDGGLTDKQQEVLVALMSGQYREVLFSGGRACGKTHVAREFLNWAWNSVVVTPDGWSHRRWRTSVGDGVAVVSAERCRGLRSQWVVVDNANDITELQLRAIASVRSVEGGVALYTATPTGPGLQWLRRRFPVVGDCGNGRYHVNASMFSNPYLTEEYLSSVRAQLGEGGKR
jgi:hypothetical protein